MPLDREVCCIIELCCGSDDKDVKALAAWLVTEADLNPHDAAEAARVIKATFDLAPKEWKLAKLFKAVGDMAREFPYV